MVSPYALVNDPDHSKTLSTKEKTVNKPESKKRISRRQFIQLSAAATAGAVLAACGGQQTPAPVPATQVPATDAPSPTAVPAATSTPLTVKETEPEPTVVVSQYQEAPMLAALVAAGQLPPVEERLPLNPRVLKPYDSIGEYGGAWQRAFRGASDRFGVHTTIAEHLLEIYQENNGGDMTLYNNVAESYEVNADATEYIWHLRKGMKWSDGVEMSADNAVWWYENVYLNSELAPNRRYDNVRQQDYLTGIEKVDDWSFKCTYSRPNPTLPLGVVRGEAWGTVGGLNFMVPHHYLQDYHPDFADEDFLNGVIAEKEVNSWVELWMGGQIGMFFFNPDLPMVGPWVMKVTVPAERIIQERNPYYYQVDPDGNQLPYLDEVTHLFYESQETFNLRLISGEVDCQFRMVQIADYPLLKENEARGGYEVKTWVADSSGGYSVNPTPRDDAGNVDEAQMAVVSQADFRRALSMAINRVEINELVYNGLSNPRGAAPVPGSPVYKKEYEELWASYDPDAANELLDGLGLTERDRDGLRLRPDGRPLVLRMDVDANPGSADEKQHTLVAEYWKEVGINTVINAMERSLRETVFFSDRHSVVAGGISNTSVPLSFDAWHNGPGAGWGRWVRTPAGETPPDLAVEPPADEPIYEMFDLIQQAYSTIDINEAHETLKQALDIFYNQCYSIGTVGASPQPVVVSNRMKNVPNNVVQANALMQINMAQPAQMYIDES
jgi:peptide/nickel transport system substrate-binding protein